jgi:hypothetical protein
MTTPHALPSALATPEAVAAPVAVSGISGALWLLGTTILCLMAVYFIGMDQGMTSVFGHNLMIHEFVHDGRHLLGFPCH